MSKVRKAVFPVAGFGTRFLPATKSIPKEMLPVVDKPVIHYAAEEAVRAGIETLIFVTGRHKRAIEDYFDAAPELEATLRAKGKDDAAEVVHSILPNGVNCIFVRQNLQLGLGHAVLCAEPAMGNEPFAVLLADDFLGIEGQDYLTDMVRAYEESGMSQIGVMPIEGPEISRYGVVKPGDGPNQVLGLVEKPKAEDAPSNLASIGRYVLAPEVMGILSELGPGVGGEIQLADAINTLASRPDCGVQSVPLTTPRFDCGQVRGYLDAILHIADRRKRPR
ncbi:UTP--glucose-1-phosphate uridylyltransferase [Roseibacterium sp. SDUM158017]|uniref:UTP--glucose-1-phosphate uridylyltransferase n=1 Tax=Roseicyclus salinarum TaxID=3036773 RepID=UPI0024152877|nr:UTP--glucose-1-phosphate uridylyltransferase [Roseibacterium sp. SDUM158017]MDG4650394.1 UTP--glucose-1-phosphate uridylyltransferase [Roseibacterium sp. SDUM158017]